MAKARCDTRARRDRATRAFSASLVAAGVIGHSASALAVPNIAITSTTPAAAFPSGTTTSFNHTVPSTGASRALIVPVGVTVSTSVISSVRWIPNTAQPTVFQTLDCSSQVVMGTNRRLAICRFLAPTPNTSATGRVTITIAPASTFAASARTFSGVIGFGAVQRVPDAASFGTGSGCTAQGTTGFNCSLAVVGVTDSYAIFDLAGQGEPGPDTRSFVPAAGQTERDNVATDTTEPHLRFATSTKIVPAAATSTTMGWFYDRATAANGVGFLALPMQGNAVTAATLGPQAATFFPGTGAHIVWTTEEEVSHLGFYVWRERGGERVRVGRSLLPGSAFMTGEFPLAGRRTYSIWDPDGDLRARYLLEEIATSGTSKFYPAITPTPGGREVGALLQALERRFVAPRPPATRAGRGEDVRAAGRPSVPTRPPEACTNAAAGVAAVKLGVARAGLHRVDARALHDAGLPEGADPGRLSLLTDGREVAMTILGEGTFEGIEFYGEGVDTRTSDARLFWLVEGGGPAKRIGAARAVAAGPSAAPATRYLARAELRERSVYFAPLLNGPASNFFGPVIAQEPVAQTMILSALEPGARPSVEVTLQGASLERHDVTVAMNGTVLGSVSWGDRRRASATFELASGVAREGANEITLTRRGSGTSVALLDRITATYGRRLVAANDVLEANLDAGASARMTGFTTGDVRVLDVTDSETPVELAATVVPEGSHFRVDVTAPSGTTTRRLRAFTKATIASPAFVEANAPSNLCASTGAEIAIVAPREFFGALEPLVEARRRAGFSVELIDVRDVFDEMTFGAPDAEALARFIALRTRGGRLKSVLLVGDASVDPRDFLGKGVRDVVPTGLVDTPAMETASDDVLADVDGDGAPDVAMGRLPARTAEEVSALVRRTLAYGGTRAFDRGALVIAGASSNGEFAAGARATEGALRASSLPVEVVDANARGGAARAELLARWSAGPSFVQFFGHGSQGVWEGLLTDADLPALAAPGRPAIVSSLTCLNGFFHDVYQDSLAEKLLRAEGGAVAVWASASMADMGELGPLAETFVENLKSQGLGEAVLRAKIAHARSGAGQAMVLLGDPSLLAAPSTVAASAPLPSASSPREATLARGLSPLRGADATPAETDTVAGAPAVTGCALVPPARHGARSALLFTALAAIVVRRLRRRATPRLPLP